MDEVEINFLADSGIMSIIGILWGLAFLGAVIFLAKGFVAYASAKRQSMGAEQLGEAAKEVKQALVGVAGLAALPAIVGIVLLAMGELN